MGQNTYSTQEALNILVKLYEQMIASGGGDVGGGSGPIPEPVSIIYENTNPVEVSIGNINVGEVIGNTSLFNILDRMFYLPPTINSFGITGISSNGSGSVNFQYNVSNPTFIWNISRGNKIKPNTGYIKNITLNEFIVDNYNIVGTSYLSNKQYYLELPGSMIFEMGFKDNFDKTISKQYTLSWNAAPVPTFASFTSVPSSTNTLEVGSIISNPSMSWSYSNSQYISPNTLTLKITDGNIELFSNNSTTTTNYIYSSNLTKYTPGSITFQISAEGLYISNLTRNITFSWKNYIFYGENINGDINSDDIRSLRVKEFLDNKKTGNILYNAGGYKYMCIPSAFNGYIKWIDPSTNFEIPYIVLDKQVSCNGVLIPYKIYRTSNILNSSITINMS